MFLPEIIGQEKLKSTLSFYYNGYKRDGYMPVICFDAPKGEGKTLFLMELAKALKRKTFLVNCGTIKSKTDLINEVLMPAAGSNEPLTVLLDEIHALHHLAQIPLLTVFAPNKDNRNTLTINNVPMTFDLHKLTFLCATTNLEKLLSPLKDRMKVLSLEEYNSKDIAKIISVNCPVFLEEDFLHDEIIKFVRINPRSAIYLAKDIEIYCKGQGSNFFGSVQWNEMRKHLDLLPYGLTRQEEKLLKIIKSSPGGSKLTHLASVMCKDNRSIQDMERYLTAQGLILNEDGRRKLTPKGAQYFDLK